MNRTNKEVKHKIQGIGDIRTFKQLLERLMVTDEDKQILTMIYVEHKTLAYIADIMGYSEATIKNRHKRCLRLIAKII